MSNTDKLTRWQFHDHGVVNKTKLMHFEGEGQQNPWALDKYPLSVVHIIGDIGQMLVSCWANVVDVGQTLNRRLVFAYLIFKQFPSQYERKINDFKIRGP